MASRFNPLTADARWQQAWDEAGTFRAEDTSGKPKAYILEMFPYPSGRIHMGHVRNYTMGDVLARYKRMRGFEVLHPMGWDAFGMPAENAAMERKVHPGSWTRANIATMKAQLKRLGFALDWSRELATCEPDYYGHEQALFLDLFAAGLVYRKESEVNWDPVDMTVLANEQVIDGRGWRSGALVERRKLSQWFLKITDFAEELLDGLDGLDQWPDKVRLMQENWIGKSRGMKFRFALDPADKPAIPEIEVYTTRPDTIFGASFVAVSPDHPLAAAHAKTSPEVADFIARCKQGGTTAAELETAEKLGLEIAEVVHPLDPDWALPVFIANFVLMDYGTGAIFGVPAHDQRDYRIREEIRPRNSARGRAQRRRGRPADLRRGGKRRRRAGQFALPRRHERRGRQGRDHPARRGRRLGRRHDGLAAARLGRLAPALLGDADPDRPLREMRRGGGAEGPAPGRAARGYRLRDARQSAGAPSDLEACRLPVLRRRGGARDRHARHLRRFLLVFHKVREPAGGPAVRQGGGGALAAGRSIYWRRRACDPASALRPLLDPRACSGSA